MEVQTLLADRGSHRAPSLPHLIVAATAELGGLTVPHLDKDFELIAEITDSRPSASLQPDSSGSAPPQASKRYVARSALVETAATEGNINRPQALAALVTKAATCTVPTEP